MTDDTLTLAPFHRIFRDLTDLEIDDLEKAIRLVRSPWGGGVGWDELLRSKRILIVSEAGAGKTYECQERQRLLWEAGEPAFFLDLATLATSTVRDMLSKQEERRLDAWLRSQSEMATFFLDSIDLRWDQVDFDAATLAVRRAKRGTPSTHPILGDEMRALRRLQREQEPSRRCVHL